MSADSDLICTPAPASQDADADPNKTMHIRQAKDSSAGRKLVIALLLLAPIAGIVVFLAMSQGGSDAVATSSGGAIDGEVSDDQGSADAVKATEPLPPECQAETTDTFTRWWCDHMFPAIAKAAADHERIDRLEAEVKLLKEQVGGSGPSGAPTWLVLLVIAIGLATAYNTVQALSKRKTGPPTEPGNP